MEVIKKWKWQQQNPLVAISILCIIICVLNALIYYSYMNKQCIVFNEINPIDTRTAIASNSSIIKNGAINVSTNNDTLDAVILNYLNEGKKIDPNLEKITHVHYDIQKQQLYLGVDKNKKYEYTFNIKSDISFTNEGMQFSIGACHVGSLKVRVPKLYFKSITGIEDQLIIPFSAKKELLKLNQVGQTDDTIIMTYIYNEDLLLSTFQKYIDKIDDTRVTVHIQKQDINALYTEIGTKKEISLETAKRCVALFEEDADNIKEFSFIFNKEGLKELYDDWNYLFIRDMPLADWYKLSEDDISEALNSYHADFLKCFLKYLYQNKDYQLDSSTILINNNPIDYRSVFGAFGYNEFIYDINIVTEENLVYAIYKVNGNDIKKLILTRR